MDSNWYLLRKGWVFLAFLSLIACSKDSNNPGTRVVGSSANQILSGNQYTKLVVEMHYPEGFKPTQTALNNFRDFIEGTCNKPGGISFTEKVIPEFQKEKLTIEDIREYEKASRDRFPSGNTMVIFALFTNTGYSEDRDNAKVLGVAYAATSFCLFQETIIEATQGGSIVNPVPSRERVESTVLNHELGHLLGLVNNGTEMVEDHQDEANGAHCTVDDCLMYFQTETSASFMDLLNGGIPQLDSQCRADIRNNGGK